MSKSKSRDQVKKQESFKKTDVNGDITKIIFPHDIQVGLKNDDFAATISGSIHHTRQGLPYLVGGNNVNITSSSNGQVTISSTASGGGSAATTSVTTYAFYQNGTPSGSPTNEFHFEWANGSVNSGDPEANAQNDFWQYFPKGGKILDVTARGGGNDNFDASNPFSQLLVFAMYTWGDTWINSSNNTTHAGYTPTGHVTSSAPGDDVANESGTYSHKAVWNMDSDYLANNKTGTFDIGTGDSISITFKGTGTAGALSNTTFFITVEKNL